MAGQPRGDSARAHQLWLAATAREALLDEDGAYALFRAAYRADPSYLPAQRTLLSQMIHRFPAAQRRRILADAPVSTADLACLMSQTTYAHGEYARMLGDLRSIARRHGATPCIKGAIAIAESSLPREQQPAELMSRDWPEAIAASAGDLGLFTAYASMLETRGDSAAARRLLLRALASTEYWRDRLSIEEHLIALASAQGDADLGRRETMRLNEWARRDGRPALRVEIGVYHCSSVPAPCRDWGDLLRIATAHRDGFVTYSLEKLAGRADVETGFPRDGLALLLRASATADSVGWSPLRAEVGANLGRAYLKLGRWDDAIRALTRTAPLVDPEDPYDQADVQHNLAHAYEGAGRMTDAVRAVRRFVALTSRLSGDGSTVISLYDAGTIEWQAGLHVAARASFDSMVKVIDATRLYYFYAGDYYERVGDLARALQYYRKEPMPNSEEGARTLAGMARVFEALGMRDSADAAARKHDREVQTPDQVPMVPHLLAARGRVNEALRAARTWTDSVSARGNLQGAALAELDLATLLGERGSAEAAAMEARRAESLARRANLVDAAVRAQTLEAEADLRLGDTATALRLGSLFGAERLARVSSEARLGAELVAGDAAARAGQTRAALVHYDAAAQVVERMADVFESDLDRARLHARHMAPFDRAVRLLLAQPLTEANIASLVRWSQRRQGAALDDPADRGSGAPLSIERIRSSLGAREALVDYMLLDSAAAAIVVTKSGARVVRLPTTAGEVARLTNALRERLATAYMGQVDLDRSRVDTAAANALSRVLIRPIASVVRGRSEMTIIPDGALHLLPFDLLPVADGRLVIDEHAVALLPSARFLGLRSSALSATTDARLLLVAGNAPGAEREAADVRRLWTRGHVDVMPETATKLAAMRDSFGGYSVLHFATHARVDSRDPLGSRLVLGRSGTATLSVGDIEQMRTRANLVVLSACESDGGPLLAGEGPMGLARAFLVSGSRAVLATQWPVGDATADLMKLFYQRMAAGDAPVEALRAAKLALRRQPGRGQPFNWAGFVLVGAPEWHAD